MTKILHIDSSADMNNSITRALTARILARFDGARVTRRDVAATPLPQIDDTWVNVRNTAPEARTPAQLEAFALSDTLIAELKAADVIVIGAPVYNFAIPASLKAWIDLIARAGETFRYTASGPEGLVTGKRVIVASANAGTPPGADHDYNTRYLRFVLGFMGMTDVEVVSADHVAGDRAAAIAKANGQIDALDHAAMKAA